jgi:hypothetical protein
MPIYAVQDNNWNRAGPLMAGDAWRTHTARLRVVASTPQSPLLYVEVDDPAVLEHLKTTGEILDYGPEKTDFSVRWIEPPDDVIIAYSAVMPEEVGDTYQLMLEQIEPILRAVNYGDGAVIFDYDTGLRASHEAFNQDKIVVPNPGFDDTDSHGHGTFTAGQMHGLLPNARLVPIKLLDGANGSGTESKIIQHLHRGLDYWRAMGSPIAAANNSWGSDGGSDGIDTAFRYVHQNGLYMTNAQGNAGPSAVQPGSPTRIARFVAAAMDRTLNNAPFTSGGDAWAITTGWWSGVDEWGPNLDGGYRQMSGTSMADPWLTCTLLILRMLHPEWAESQLLSYILTHAQGMARAMRNGRGHGVIGLDAIPNAEPTPEPAPEPEPPPSMIIPEAGPLRDAWNVSLEVEEIVNRAQKAREQGARNPSGPDWNQVLSEVGSIKDYMGQVRQNLTEVAQNIPKVPGQPTEPPISILKPGSYTFKYGDDAREYAQVVIPNVNTGEVDLILAGGAWQTGGDPGAIPLEDGGALDWAEREVQQWYALNRHIMVMGAYPLNNIASAVNSARKLLRWIAAECAKWGGDVNEAHGRGP